MEVAVDLYLAVPLLFTVLALVLASVFVRLRGGEGERAAERPREPAAAEPAREGGSVPGGEAAAPEEAGAAAVPEDEVGRVPVEEVGAGEEEAKEAAEPGPAVEPSPAATESSIPRSPATESSIPPPPPAEPREPENREEAENKAQFDRYLSAPDSLVMSQLNFLLSATVKEQIIKQSTELVCRAYSELYAAVMDPSNEYKDPETILHRSPHQVQALLS